MALVDRGEGARIALRRKAGEPPVAQHAQRGTTAACRAERNYIRRSHCSPIGRKLELLSTFLDERSNCDRSNSSSRGGTERFVGQERLRRGRGFAGEGSGGSRSGPVGLRRGPARVDLEGYTVIADKGFAGEDFERLMSELRAIFRRPDRKGEQPRLNVVRGRRSTDRPPRTAGQRRCSAKGVTLAQSRRAIPPGATEKRVRRERRDSFGHQAAAPPSINERMTHPVESATRVGSGRRLVVLC